MEKKTDNSLSSNIFQKFMTHILFIIKIEKKNFFTNCFFVLRIINFLFIQKIKQKYSDVIN